MSASYYGQFPERPQRNLWHSLNRVMVMLIVLAICILVMCAFLPLIKQQREMASRVYDLRAELDKKKLTLDRANREEDFLRNDPGYLELIARDRLDLMKEGEAIFRLDPPPAPEKPSKLNK